MTESHRSSEKGITAPLDLNGSDSDLKKHLSDNEQIDDNDDLSSDEDNYDDPPDSPIQVS
jgi:hypothetical protein